MERQTETVGGGVSGFLHAVPSTSIQLAFLTKQPGWSQSSESLRPPSGSGTLVLCEFPVCLVEDLAVLLPGGTLGGTQEEGGGEGEGEKHKREGQRGGWREEGKGRDTEHSRVGIDLLH